MAGLQQTYDTLREEIGFSLGWGSAPSQWDAPKLKRIEAAIREGVSKFLWGSLAPGTGKVYQWSFLRQTFAFSTTNAVWEYLLPEDFGQQEERIYYSDDNWRNPIHMTNEALIDRKRSLDPDASGPPMWAAVRATGDTSVTPQRWNLIVFPTPDATYELRMPYRINGEMLSASTLYPRGGREMSRAILLACKSEAMLQTNDDRSLEDAYQAALAAAINYDATRKGGNLGYNADRSDDRERGVHVPRNVYTVTHEGSYSDETITLADL